MIDSGEGDDKVIAVPKKDLRWEGVKDLADINPHTIKEIKHFLETYKTIEEGEHVEITGVEGREAAQAAVTKSLALYQEKFPEA